MFDTHGALRLIELTSARLCHEVSGTAGPLDDSCLTPASGAALEPDVESPAPAVLRTLKTRLELRRAAWGPESGSVPLARIRFLARGLPENVAADVAALALDTVFSASAGRIVLNLLLLAAESLASGGTVVLAGATDDLFVRITGPDAAWPTGLAVCLTGEAEARAALNDPRGLQMALTALLAHVAGMRLSVLLSPTAGNDPAILRLGR